MGLDGADTLPIASQNMDALKNIGSKLGGGGHGTTGATGTTGTTGGAGGGVRPAFDAP